MGRLNWSSRQSSTDEDDDNNEPDWDGWNDHEEDDIPVDYNNPDWWKLL